MGFIKNIEVWQNHRPRVCNFDITDFCNYSAIGNTCTDNSDLPNFEELFFTQTATYNAWLKAIDEYFTASISFYYDAGYTDPDTGAVIIPDGLYNEKCVPLANFTALCDLYYGPTGFNEKNIDFIIKKAQIQNALRLNTDPDKKTGVYTYTINIPVAPFTPTQPYTYTVDFTDYQIFKYDMYLDYRNILGILMQQLKKIMTATADHPLTAFNIPPETCSDVQIGTQIWTKCNLDVTTYRNGDIIPQVQDPVQWANLTTGAWCYYNNDTANGPVTGKLYNWYAVNDPRGLAPTGYHVPSDIEWSTLINFLETAVGVGYAGGEMKTIGRVCTTITDGSNWLSPNTDANNRSGFTGLPGGGRSDTGSYSHIGDNGYWWTSTAEDIASARFYNLKYDFGDIFRGSNVNNTGFSVRLIKDQVCADVTIGTQTWTSCNLSVTTYNNGDAIPQVTDPTQWASLTTGAWCYYNNDPLTEPLYGKLYNWYAINDPRGIALPGYYLPTDADWTILTNYLGGDTVAGGKMKEVGTTHWLAPNTSATNSSRFTGLPGGYRNENGTYSNIGNFGQWWSSTEYNTSNAWMIYLSYAGGVAPIDVNEKTFGLSVRLIKY